MGCSSHASHNYHSFLTVRQPSSFWEKPCRGGEIYFGSWLWRVLSRISWTHVLHEHHGVEEVGRKQRETRRKRKLAKANLMASFLLLSPTSSMVQNLSNISTTGSLPASSGSVQHAHSPGGNFRCKSALANEIT